MVSEEDIQLFVDYLVRKCLLNCRVVQILEDLLGLPQIGCPLGDYILVRVSHAREPLDVDLG